jgi:hypothetical protein
MQIEDMWDHRRNLFEKSAHKLVSQAISNGQIRASNEYLEMFEGPQLVSFHDGSNSYLTEEQYAMVNTCWSKFHYLLTLFLLFLMYN